MAARTGWSGVLILAWLGLGAAGLCTAPPETITVTPKQTDAVLLNPGKGWVLYRLPANHTKASLAVGTTGYGRFLWSVIEPAEGEFNWKPIDNALAAWHKAGKQYAFGIMAANIHYRGKYATPKWVFDAGCPARNVQQERPESSPDEAAFHQYEGPQVIPAQWDHPVFMAKLRALLAALAKRYDGDARLAWYETRSYGNWGEGHLWPWRGKDLSHAGRYKHILMHKELFKNTLLVTSHHYIESDRHYRRVVSLGIGVRDDGVMSFRDGSRTAGALGKSPGIFEWGGSYRQFLRDGTWTRKGRRLEDVIETGHASYVGLSRHNTADVKAFVEAEKDLIERMANRMGYHFVLTKAVLPKRITAGRTFTMKLSWANRGVAHIYVPCDVSAALLDEEGRAVARADVTGCMPARWPPDKTTVETASVTFEKVTPGTYRLAIGLFPREDKPRPIRLALKAVTPDGWHPLAKVQIQAK